MCFVAFCGLEGYVCWRLLSIPSPDALSLCNNENKRRVFLRNVISWFHTTQRRGTAGQRVRPCSGTKCRAAGGGGGLPGREARKATTARLMRYLLHHMQTVTSVFTPSSLVISHVIPHVSWRAPVD